jgi:hypothetical protein
MKQANEEAAGLKDAIHEAMGKIPPISEKALAGVGLGLGATAAGLMAVPPMLRRMATRHAARKVEQYNKLPVEQKKEDTVMRAAQMHPYATSLAAGALPAMTAYVPGLGASAPVTAVAGNVMAARPAGIMLGQKVRDDHTSGLGAGFSYRHPFLGTWGSRLIPFVSAPNRYVAGQGIADRAMERNSFLARHPAAGAYFGQMIPFMGSPYAHAAGLIEHQRAMEGM